MALIIRRAVPTDAPQWLELVKSGLGNDYPAKQVYDPAWIASQFTASSNQETWVAESNSRLCAAVSLLAAEAQTTNPVMNLGRQLLARESLADESAKALVTKINALADERGQWVVARVLTSDNASQILFETLGFAAIGFQPAKHVHRVREGVLYYLRSARTNAETRLPLSDALPMVNELAALVMNRLHIATPQGLRDGVTGYPLQSELGYQEASVAEYQTWRGQAQTVNPPIEISRGYNLGSGLFRVLTEAQPQALMGRRGDKVVAGVVYLFDDQDRCVRIIDGCATDDLAMGALFNQVLKTASDRLHAVYVEVDVLSTAPRLLKCTEQLGFVPVAYFPGFYRQNTHCADVVKMVKLNMLYSPENATFTAQARSVVEAIDHNFQDQKMGLAIINLLRSLPIFGGLGEGELRKIARLFTQKLYRPGDVIFKQNDVGNEAYVVMRGQVEVVLPTQAQPIATISNGQIFGEQAFLDGAARGATVRASQPSILLMVQRSAFYDLVEREPHLGMVIMRNTAIELSQKLRKANVSLAAAKQAK